MFTLPIRYGLVVATAAGIAACSSSLPSAPGNSFTKGLSAPLQHSRSTYISRGFLKRNASTGILFVGTNYAPGAIFVLDTTRAGWPTVGEITDSVTQPTNLALDDKGTLYVPNVGFSSASGSFVAEYPAGHIHPSKILTDGITYPWGVAVNSRGDLYVANVYGEPKTSGTPGPAAIVAYKRGKSAPFLTVPIPHGGEIAFDGDDNLFILDGDDAQVYELKAGSKVLTNLGFTFQGLLASPSSIAANGNGGFYIGSLGATILSAGAIAIYKPGAMALG
jgi:hypothetical protein